MTTVHIHGWIDVWRQLRWELWSASLSLSKHNWQVPGEQKKWFLCEKIWCSIQGSTYKRRDKQWEIYQGHEMGSRSFDLCSTNHYTFSPSTISSPQERIKDEVSHKIDQQIIQMNRTQQIRYSGDSNKMNQWSVFILHLLIRKIQWCAFILHFQKIRTRVLLKISCEDTYIWLNSFEDWYVHDSNLTL